MSDFAGLKPGDKVAVRYGSGRRVRIHLVEGVTPTGKIRVDGRLYKPSGSVCGDASYDSPRLALATPEVITEARPLAAKEACGRISFDTLTVDALEEILRVAKSGGRT